jgi:hypothetical protein
MSEQPFRSGGMVGVPTNGPVLVRFSKEEPICKSPAHAREWLATQGVTEDWMREHGITQGGGGE